MKAASDQSGLVASRDESASRSSSSLGRAFFVSSWLGRLVCLIVLVSGGAVVGSETVSAEGTLKVLHESGPRDRRINFVMFAEGYMDIQEWMFDDHVAARAEYFLSTPPFDSYRDFINIYGIYVPSNQQGADHPLENSYRDTYFGASYGDTMERLLGCSEEQKVYPLLEEHVPEYDIIVILVNDPSYGGSAGGEIAVASRGGSGSELVLHELAHSYGELADEYEYSGRKTASLIEEANVTQDTIREQIKWNAWIDSTTLVPTPETSYWANMVGLFRGAAYDALLWYRSRWKCRMRALTHPFCEICAEQLIRVQYRRISPIDSVSPGTPVLGIDTSQTQVLRMTPMVPSGHGLTVAWSLDGTPQPAAIDSMIVHGGTLGVGDHTVRVVVADTTALVRTDGDGVLTDSVTWQITVMDHCPCLCLADPACDSSTNVLDVVQAVNVAFRNQAPIADLGCGYVRTDADCSGVTNVLDVVRIVNVAFRGTDPQIEFCSPCSL